MKTVKLLGLCLLSFALRGIAHASAAQSPHYVGELIDGTKINGEQLTGIQEAPSAWRLDGTPLFGDNPLRWLKDRTLTNGTPPASFIEFRNGDILPGDVSHYSPAGQTGATTAEPCLVLSTPTGPDLVDVPRRIEGRKRAAGVPPRTALLDIAQIRRIVWQRRTNDQFTPKTLYYRDGKSVVFRSLRWEDSAVKILSEQGPATVTFDEIAELHFEASDPWTEYTRQLATLMPELHGRLAQFETDEGARITASTDRYQLPANSSISPQTVRSQVRLYNLQIVQPVWSLDPIWLDMAKIRTRRYFGPHEVPLSALTPALVEQSTGLARSWRPQVDRNAQGGPLVNGGVEYGWGWGAHAFNRLEFDLPPFARTFQTKIGLDQVAGRGGCARGVVSCTPGGERVTPPENRPLFSSPVLIGSKESTDSGKLDLPDVGKKGRKLVLLADPLLKDHPPGADPLEIRDVLDWLQPLVTLDPQELREEVSQTAKELKAKPMPADREAMRAVLAQYAPGFEPGQPELRFRNEPPTEGSRIELMPSISIFPQLLRRLVEVPPNKITKLQITDWRRSVPPSLAVLANGTALWPPVDGMNADQIEPLQIDLTPYAGRRIALEIDFIAPRATTFARFRRIEIISTDPPAKEEKKTDAGK